MPEVYIEICRMKIGIREYTGSAKKAANKINS